MAVAEDLISFDLIETHKENIQSLPGGRSARQLASILSPLSCGKAAGAPTLDETKTLNDAIRQEYEIELQSIADSDDPLDIYDRYVKWTLNAYPSAQATPQSQLLPLLERATKAFLTSSHYKNDPRYLKLWLHYIRLFSDAPRETFAFLARHNIGEGLGLFYEEFAAWLEGAGRWSQAEEVYKLGIEREARPAERLMRKYNQFRQRFEEARPHTVDEPTSPALPTVRPALAAKVDPFASAPRSDDPQAPRPNSGVAGGAGASRSGKPKMAIFSDADNVSAAQAAGATKGWDSIGSIKERKKENAMEARPWTGETLKAGKKAGTVPKMEIFKDPTARDNESHKVQSTRAPADVINPRTGRAERVFVSIEAVYPNERQEFSFEELRAMRRGWASRDWKRQPQSPLRPTAGNRNAPQTDSTTSTKEEDKMKIKATEPTDVENLSLHDVSTQSTMGMPETKAVKQRRIKIREVKQEVQTVKTRLESPTRPKLRRKGSAEPTMTFHSKAAANEIYDIFNQPLRKAQAELAPARDDTQSGDETDLGGEGDDDGYSTAGESTGTGTGTGRISMTNSEYGDDTLASGRASGEDNTESQPGSVSPWSDFTASKHVPKLVLRDRHKSKHQDLVSEDMTENGDSSRNQTTHSFGAGGGAFDTLAIAAIANQDFGELDTQMIAQLAGDDGQDENEDEEGEADADADQTQHGVVLEQVVAPEGEGDGKGSDNTSGEQLSSALLEPVEIHNKPRYIPLPPEDYEPTPLRPFRNPATVANNKLSFMTPIVERTESSLAPSTIFADHDQDYFDSKTPSRSALLAGTKYDSPSKWKVNELLLSSPTRRESPALAAKKLRQREEEEKSQKKRIPSLSPQKTTEFGTVAELGVQNGSQIPFLGPPEVTTALSAAKTDKATFITSVVPATAHAVQKGPIIADLQCNPCDSTIREQILSALHPGLSYPGCHDHSTQDFNHRHTLKSYADKVAKQKGGGKASPRKSQNEKTVLTKPVPPILRFAGTSRVYAVKRELGQGAFAPVYLVDSYDPNEAEDPEQEVEESTNPVCQISTPASGRGNLEALKTEAPPDTLVWEFHILRLLRQRLGHTSRTMQSIVIAHECHLYRDESYLVLSYSAQGTLLDLVNLARSESVKAGKPVEGLDEALAMWLGVELLRILEEIHKVGILHGDLKADNCLVRFDGGDVTGPYDANGKQGWAAKGLKLIDFGRGIDVRCFKKEAQFIADWEAKKEDCAEIRECRPWKWQIDYHGAAGVVHNLLFGRYLETIPVPGTDGVGQKKEWKLKESLKRYWDRDLWVELFALLLNPASVGDREEMPVMGNLRRVRVKMERWLREEGERGAGGRDLRSSLKRMERLVQQASVKNRGW